MVPSAEHPQWGSSKEGHSIYRLLRNMKKVLFKWMRKQGMNQSTNFRFLQRLSIIFGSRRDCLWSLVSCQDYRPWKMASCRDCLCDSASCWDSRQEAKSHGQSLQEAIRQALQSRQEVRDRGQSPRKPNMMDSLCRKWKSADSFIPCGEHLKFQHPVFAKGTFVISYLLPLPTKQFQNWDSLK